MQTASQVLPASSTLVIFPSLFDFHLRNCPDFHGVMWMNFGMLMQSLSGKNPHARQGFFQIAKECDTILVSHVLSPAVFASFPREIRSKITLVKGAAQAMKLLRDTLPQSDSPPPFDGPMNFSFSLSAAYGITKMKTYPSANGNSSRTPQDQPILCIGFGQSLFVEKLASSPLIRWTEANEDVKLPRSLFGVVLNIGSVYRFTRLEIESQCLGLGSRYHDTFDPVSAAQHLESLLARLNADMQAGTWPREPAPSNARQKELNKKNVSRNAEPALNGFYGLSPRAFLPPEDHMNTAESEDSVAEIEHDNAEQDACEPTFSEDAGGDAPSELSTHPQEEPTVVMPKYRTFKECIAANYRAAQGDVTLLLAIAAANGFKGTKRTTLHQTTFALRNKDGFATDGTPPRGITLPPADMEFIKKWEGGQSSPDQKKPAPSRTKAGGKTAAKKQVEADSAGTPPALQESLEDILRGMAAKLAGLAADCEKAAYAARELGILARESTRAKEFQQKVLELAESHKPGS